MTTQRAPGTGAMHSRNDSLARMQETLDVAATGALAGVPVSAEEEQVLRRIAEQRRRIIERRARAGSQAVAMGLHGQRDEGGAPHASSLLEHPVVAAGRDAVLRHPIAIGFALGSALVLGPRRLWRVALVAAPWALRGWRLIERTNRGKVRARR
ncbi:hypothetical protein AAV94_13430 [Lampropedia cohaerens]|uniref:Uncharacterized protein n=1 Tax=Lampropedia cohaerens TaxID=1610491 RepID=A0A0U1PW82_9BURK|nr:hypothetical protein [Lampropedia cohaerens]KKW66760.1 hypothetical protein AAV94_13430 [Lampropedia cohaerens]